MNYHTNILELTGNTPLVRLGKMSSGLKPLILLKIEFFNPGFSVKDRIAVSMIENAEKHGLIKPGGTIVEGTSGNTGIGLAMVAAVKGYKMITVMPDKMSQEKINILKAYGSEVVLTPTAVDHDHPDSYAGVANRLTQEIPNAYQPAQFENPVNPLTHYETTGREIWEQTDGKVSHLFAGMGTGGTITGIARFLKEKNPKVKIFGIDPEGSFYTKDEPKPYHIEGIGLDFIPKTIDTEIIDEMIRVSDRDAFIVSRRLAKEEGVLAGGSSGAALWGALKIAENCSLSDVIVVIIPDSGRNYLSKCFNDDFMKTNNLI